MHKILQIGIRKTGYAIGLAVAALVGGLTSAVVLAAIPSSDGTIYGCYSSNGNLRVIDAEAGKTCNGQDKPIQWNTTSGGGSIQAAYAKFAVGNVPLAEATLDPIFTEGITASKVASHDDGWCFTVAFSPKLGLVQHSGAAAGTSLYVRGLSAQMDSNIDEFCGPEYNAFADMLGPTASANTSFIFYN